MADVLLCSRSFSSEQLRQLCAITQHELQALEEPHRPIMPYRPYLMTTHLGPEDQAIRAILCAASPRNLHTLTDISLDFGADTTIALAEIMETLRSESVLAFVGAGTSVYAGRMKAFGQAIQRYQEALLRYRAVIEGNAAPSVRQAARQQALDAFAKLQAEFRHELKVVTSRIKARRGTPLNDPQRALNIATSSRSAAKLNVMSQVEAHNLVQFAKYARYLGNGLVAVDFASRAGNVHNEYWAEGNWERELFTESLSFSLSTIVGTTTARLGVSSLSLVIALTQFGWIGLIVAGTVVTGLSAAAAFSANYVIRRKAGKWHDAITNWISGR